MYIHLSNIAIHELSKHIHEKYVDHRRIHTKFSKHRDKIYTMWRKSYLRHWWFHSHKLTSLYWLKCGPYNVQENNHGIVLTHPPIERSCVHQKEEEEGDLPIRSMNSHGNTSQKLDFLHTRVGIIDADDSSKGLLSQHSVHAEDLSERLGCKLTLQ